MSTPLLQKGPGSRSERHLMCPSLRYSLRPLLTYIWCRHRCWVDTHPQPFEDLRPCTMTHTLVPSQSILPGSERLQDLSFPKQKSIPPTAHKWSSFVCCLFFVLCPERVIQISVVPTASSTFGMCLSAALWCAPATHCPPFAWCLCGWSSRVSEHVGMQACDHLTSSLF